MERFVHLRVHSEYSLLEGACKIDELVRQAKQLGMSALAITDYGTMYGVIPFYKACMQHGIKPIIGVTLDVIHGNLTDRVRDEKRYSMVLLAENDAGYRSLLQLVTRANLQTAHGKPKVNKDLLRQHAEGLIAYFSGSSGEIQELLLDRQLEAAVQRAKEYEGLFGKGQFFLELQDHGLEEQRVLNQRILQCSQQSGVPLIATNSVHYLTPKDSWKHDVLLCIGSGKLISDTTRFRLPNQQFYLKNQDEMSALFPYARAAVENTCKIADRCHVEISFGQHILPKFPLPEGSRATDYLKELCQKGLNQRYAQPSKEAQERLAYELSVIDKMGFSDYFLIVWDFMRFAHQQGIVTGPGRGSAAGSLVAYVLQITNVDPLKYKLLFERFLNPERISMPDIDIDFEVERRGEVIEYVSQKYGKEFVAQIITFGTMAARAAIRDIGRVMNFPANIVDRTAKWISQGMTLDEAIRTVPELKDAFDENEETQRLIQYAKGIEGLPRHASTHAAGIVISREPLTHYVPLQQGQEGHSLTQYSMEHLEEIGLLKMDFLGLRNLTIIESALHLIRLRTNPLLKLEEIPHDDAKTYKMLTQGDTTGIFQLESAGMRNVLKEVKPSSLEDIIAILALYRPGPMEIIPEFAAAKNGKRPVTYLHDDLREILADTYGFILYQEQIMQIASTMAGYSLGEADVLRRAVSKKKREVLEKQREQFVSGCLKKGYPHQVAQELYDLIVRFADYGFNRSHSAAYSLIAYQMAYLKANYPLEFMTALLTLAIGNVGKVAEYVEETRRRGIPVRLPDINQSEAAFSICDNGILFGLSAIKNVGIHAIGSILQERKKRGPFSSLSDFCRRVDPRICNRRVLEALIQSGALDSLPGHRAQKLSVIDLVLEKGQEWRREHADGQGSLFQVESVQGVEVQYPDIPPFTKKELLQLEKELLGLYVSGHPLEEYDAIFQRKEVIPLYRLDAHVQETVLVAGMILEAKTITTRKGSQMAFILLEDKASQAELVVFPTTFEKEAALWKKNRMVVVQGKVEKQEEQIKLIVQKGWDMASLPAKKQASQSLALFIRISEPLEGSGQLMDIQEELLKFSGNYPVYLYYEAKKETKKLQEKYHVNLQPALISRLEGLVGKESVIVKEWNK
ncbi:DNA polymerase III subunit alpha [Ammoniphilus sp. YIM 78166]|uniref:DNA polymerase III subunit alpha n=1 Tax=Ammoniphilus sp. YIM 78166 TaxID=1644106 RepID=UPI00106F7ABB|nr:DNA polymerase III subunit alpha [Ammoniphilus sp. YIM 78166]